nr:MAG TPA: hypothetical protein [Caudoviricetes sp.]
MKGVGAFRNSIAEWLYRYDDRCCTQSSAAGRTCAGGAYALVPTSIAELLLLGGFLCFAQDALNLSAVVTAQTASRGSRGGRRHSRDARHHSRYNILHRGDILTSCDRRILTSTQARRHRIRHVVRSRQHNVLVRALLREDIIDRHSQRERRENERNDSVDGLLLDHIVGAERRQKRDRKGVNRRAERTETSAGVRNVVVQRSSSLLESGAPSGILATVVRANGDVSARACPRDVAEPDVAVVSDITVIVEAVAGGVVSECRGVYLGVCGDSQAVGGNGEPSAGVVPHAIRERGRAGSLCLGGCRCRCGFIDRAATTSSVRLYALHEEVPGEVGAGVAVVSLAEDSCQGCVGGDTSLTARHLLIGQHTHGDTVSLADVSSQSSSTLQHRARVVVQPVSARLRGATRHFNLDAIQVTSRAGSPGVVTFIHALDDGVVIDTIVGARLRVGVGEPTSADVLRDGAVLASFHRVQYYPLRLAVVVTRVAKVRRHSDAVRQRAILLQQKHYSSSFFLVLSKAGWPGWKLVVHSSRLTHSSTSPGSGGGGGGEPAAIWASRRLMCEIAMLITQRALSAVECASASRVRTSDSSVRRASVSSRRCFSRSPMRRSRASMSTLFDSCFACCRPVMNANTAGIKVPRITPPSAQTSGGNRSFFIPPPTTCQAWY